MPEKQHFKTTDPVKYLELLNLLMIEKNASDMYLTYGEPPALRILEQIQRQNELEKMGDERLNAIALSLMNQTGIEFFERHGSIDL